jgi:hypothetical protein
VEFQLLDPEKGRLPRLSFASTYNRRMEKRIYKRRSEQVWAAVRRDYLAGMPAQDAARLHDVTVSALRARACKEGWSRYLHAPPPPPLNGPEASGDDPRLALPAHDGPHDAPDDGLDAEADDTALAGDPADLARAATLASGQAMRAGHWTQAHALASLAERYRKLAGREDARRRPLTPDTAPLQLVVDILMDEDLPNRRLARDPDNLDADPVAAPYHRWRQRLSRLNQEFSFAQISRRVACDRRIDALEAQLAAAGLTPVPETDRARRIRLGEDMQIGPGGKVVSTADWEKSMDER